MFRTRPEDIGHEYSVTIQIRDPENRDLIPPFPQRLVLAQSPDPRIAALALPATAALTLRVGGATTDKAGRHEVAISVDGEEVRAIPFEVVHGVAPN